MPVEGVVAGVGDGKTVSSLDEDGGREVVVEPKEPPALDAGGGGVDVGADGVVGGKGECRWTRVSDRCARVVVDEVDAIDVAGGDGKGVVVTAMDVLGILALLVDGDLDEMALAVWVATLKKK